MAKETFSAARIFGEETEPIGGEKMEETVLSCAERSAQEMPSCAEKPTEQAQMSFFTKAKKRVLSVLPVLATVLVFALFAAFLLKQFSYAHPTHDDYGYATLSYVYWEPDMYGQNFSMDQFVHYLVQHYNRWSGRILSFGQIILLMKPGEQTAQVGLALLVFGIFVLSFVYAQRAKKARFLPMAALFTCALFGLLGKNMAISGLYWYCAAILYTVPVLYVLVAAGLMYLLLLDRSERTFSLSKLRILPFTCVVSFFAGWSMEQVGVFAVVTIAAIIIYACFTRRNPFLLLYGFPPLTCATVGCHYLINAIGNESRKSSYPDYYSLPLIGQMRASAQTIAQAVFCPENLFLVMLIVGTGVAATVFLLKKKRATWRVVLALLHGFLGAVTIGITLWDWHTEATAQILWLYLVVFAVAVSVWLFSDRAKQDFLIWAIFFGGLASQGASLVSPIFPSRCLMPFALAMVLVSTRAFSELGYADKAERKDAGKRRFAWLRCDAAVLIAVLAIGGVGAARIFIGFEENEPVNAYNERRLQLASYEYNEKGLRVHKLSLMRLKDDTYAGSTQPYGRELIKDWMKIYYMLPDTLQYDDFEYEPYDEERLKELQDALDYEEYFVQKYGRIPY